jgi:hypothetical protein
VLVESINAPEQYVYLGPFSVFFESINRGYCKKHTQH